MTASTVHAAVTGGRVRAWRQVLRALPRWVPSAALAAVVMLVLAVWVRSSGGTPFVGILNWLPVPLAVCGVIGAWTGLVDALLRQNRANHARLVPHHARALREVLLLIWCVLLGGIALAALAGGVAVLKVVAYAACVLALLAVAMRWLAMWLILWFLLSGLRPGVDRLLAAVEAHAVPIWLTLPAIVLAVGVPLCALIGTGSARHRRHGERRAGWERSFKAKRSLGGTLGWPWDDIGRLSRAPYDAAARRVLARPGRSVWPRLMLVFGPTTHVAVHVAWAVFIAVAAVVALGGFWLFGRFPPASLRAVELAGPSIGVMALAMSATLGLPSALCETRREQALVVLLPGVPRGAALNRGLAARWLAHLAAGWAIGAVVVLLAVHALAPASTAVFAAGLLSVWPLAALVVRDVARLPPSAGRHIFSVVMSCALGPGLLAASFNVGGLPLVVGPAIALATLAWLSWRWRKLRDSPSALPAGRLAR